MLHQVALEPNTATYLSETFFSRVAHVRDGGLVKVQKTWTLPAARDRVTTVTL